MLYQVETKVLNQAVKRNIQRFPDNFRFQLKEEEYVFLRSQIVTSNKTDACGTGGGRRYRPFVFTEQGIAMLSAILRSEVAIQVSIIIMDTFVEMRKYMTNVSFLHERLNAMEIFQLNYQKEINEKFETIFEYISEHDESIQKVFFDGQIYDAFSLIANLIQRADSKIILLDSYVDIITLNLLSKKKTGVAVTIYTSSKAKLTDIDVNNFNEQYATVEVKYTKVFHDRFLILDCKTAYHIGASLKDAGRKCFGINLIQNKGIISDILKRLELEKEKTE